MRSTTRGFMKSRPVRMIVTFASALVALFVFTISPALAYTNDHTVHLDGLGYANYEPEARTYFVDYATYGVEINRIRLKGPGDNCPYNTPAFTDVWVKAYRASDGISMASKHFDNWNCYEIKTLSDSFRSGQGTGLKLTIEVGTVHTYGTWDYHNGFGSWGIRRP